MDKNTKKQQSLRFLPEQTCFLNVDFLRKSPEFRKSHWKSHCVSLSANPNGFCPSLVGGFGGEEPSWRVEEDSIGLQPFFKAGGATKRKVARNEKPQEMGFASLLAQFEELHVFKLLFFFISSAQTEFLLFFFFQPTLMNTRRQAEKRSDVKIRLFVKWTSTLLLTPAQPLVVLCAHLFFPLAKGSIFQKKKKKKRKKK